MNKEDTVTKENYNEQMDFPNTWEEFEMDYGFYDTNEVYTNGSRLIQSFRVKQWLEHQMTAEEYRQRMIQAFHNADCDRLIAICALPTEKEFEHLEWLLKTHYKKEPCEDAISRQAALAETYNWSKDEFLRVTNPFDYLRKRINSLPSVTPQPKTGYWTPGSSLCSCCGKDKFKNFNADIWTDWFPKFCPNCGAKMEIRENDG